MPTFSKIVEEVKAYFRKDDGPTYEYRVAMPVLPKWTEEYSPAEGYNPVKEYKYEFAFPYYKLAGIPSQSETATGDISEGYNLTRRP